MTHDEALHLLSARLDGPLAPEQQHDLDAWLAQSPDHQVLADAFQTDHADLRAAYEPRRQAARETAAAVARQLSGASLPAPSRWSARRLRVLTGPLSAACAAAVLIGLGLLLLRGRPEQTPPDGRPAASTRTPETIVAIGLKPRPRPDVPQPSALAVGQAVTTEPGERRRLRLPDGSFLYVNQDTTIRLTRDRTLRLDRGEVFLEAVPAKSPAERFVVETPTRTATALGTKFFVRSDEAGTGVLVSQGSVQVSGLDQSLTSGQLLAPGANQVAPAPRASAAVEWTRDLMIAAETPLVPAGKYSGGSLVALDPYGQEAKLSLVKYHVDVHIEDGFARTTIDQTYFNSENFQMEGTFYFPIPPDASLSRLAMYVEGDLMEGGMAERGHARDVYERIRYQNRDPALLEWVDGSVFKMRVFPLEARQQKRIILSYTQRLPAAYGQSTYRFPAGHTLAVVDEWSFEARVKDGLRLVPSSPSHPDMRLEHRDGDLVAVDSARNAKIDRDVVLTLFDPNARQPNAVRWSSAELDGQKYLMVRYRPELPAAPRRERRDWVFLFESSGARDPLVARTQVEVIRSLLAHAEHSDTFSILSVGTRVRTWEDTPQTATPDNVARAIEWLDNRHLIGALNLDQALSDAGRILEAGENPHLVHVGGGIASIGEQRADMLVQRIPAGTRYVGIGVGKRVSPAFMKVAAERTGGLFTQVNPDEAIAWRGFEIASTLNAPRLLNIRVETPGVNGLRFLAFSSVLAHGEELAAVANVTHATPTAVTVRGTLDGQPFERVLPVENVAPDAGYLPRTWAKLEIDRLLAEDSSANQQAITNLSKAMYVMTPFTSLLVLENEQMYQEFRVDRGRKDHWALYPCPNRIPVVYIPDPNMPAGSRPNLKGQKPHANAVLQTILVRNRATYLTWPGHNAGDNPVQTAGQRYGGALPLMLGDDLARKTGLEQLNKSLEDRSWREVDEVDSPAQTNFHFGIDKELSRVDRLLRNPTPAFGASVNGTFLRRQNGRVGTDRLEAGESVWDFRSIKREPSEFFDTSDLLLERRSPSGLNALFAERQDRQRGLARRAGAHTSEWEERAVAEPFGRESETFKRQLPQLRTYDRFGFAPLLDARNESDRKKLRLWDTDGLALLNPEFYQDAASANGPIHPRSGLTTAPAYYGRPSFSGNQRVFTDLPAYASGMTSSPADIRAVLEAEAAPRFGSRRGSVDPVARKLIEAARTADWKALQVPVGERKITVLHDGQGRYSYERPVALGLKEVVVCDGTTLWHLYPEIGVGARRTVSRFHRAEVLDLIPGFLLPADDLAHGADVKAVDDRTVALVPVRPTMPEELTSSWVEVHLVFDGPRLAERRWVLRSAKDTSRVLARQVHDAGRTRTLVPEKDGTEKLIEQADHDTAPAAAPRLTPDLGGLVVLPMPLRSREHVYRDLDMEAGWDLFHDRNACFAYRDEESILQLLACEFASNNGYNVARIWDAWYAPKQDRRPGFFTLMLAAGHDPRSVRHLRDEFARVPDDPLVRYLWEAQDPKVHEWQALAGIEPRTPATDTFLGKLTAFRRIVARWQGGYLYLGLWGQRDGERARVIEFATRNADNPLGWCTLAMVQDRCRTPAAWQAVADAWTVLAEKSAMRYPALYEQARCLGQAGNNELAQVRYQELFAAALKQGVLPPLDASFRSVLEDGKQDHWAKLMRQTARLCAEQQARPVIITLAWQCYQLGDTAMADTLLDQALADVPAAEKALTGLAAVHFLNATSRHDRADQVIRELLADAKLAQSAGLWRLASQTADHRKDAVRAIEYLEKALDIEFDRMPEVFDVQPVRTDYSRLLSHYEWLADASASLQVSPPKNLLLRVVKAADRWRHLDAEAADVPNRVAALLRKLGGDGAADLAWDYATTPLALKPNEASPWVSLAWSLRQEGNWRQADRCYELAFAAEPTNAQLLWDRAQHLQQQGQVAESRNLLRQLANGDWQPRFNGLKAQARQAVEGR